MATSTRIRPPLVGLGLVIVAFLAYALPPYLGLDPAQSRVPARSGLHYALLVTHILLGSVVLVTAVLQLWPWLRRKHPAVHRWSGRVYVAAAIPAGLAALVVAPMGAFGMNQRAANTVLAVLWLATTATGYVMARRRRFPQHREWMVRSFALCFSIVVNRLWTAVCVSALVPDTNDTAALEQAIGVGSWMSWLVNLLIAEWWLQHTRYRRQEKRVSAKEMASVA
ncbi:DUF2306 domain-containing protein [Amycolatopsis thermophila]|uniref:Membrane protein n=1 Tax=Amycolatopsis thermophila TaxID=206084 RepID=A0ABU0EUZ2_9PSEU|nr:DUF2306 domain-containing protein [Amycolatopsis thermophila]MDQ0379093.1 putative membrane protein [Amycolatopsis thermophila]